MVSMNKRFLLSEQLNSALRVLRKIFALNGWIQLHIYCEMFILFVNLYLYMTSQKWSSNQSQARFPRARRALFRRRASPSRPHRCCQMLPEKILSC